MLTRSWLRIHVTEQAVWSCLRIKSIAGHSYRACNSLKPLFSGFKVSLPCRIHHEVLQSRTLCIIDHDSGIIGRVCQAVVGHAGKCVEQHPDILNTIRLGTRAQKIYGAYASAFSPSRYCHLYFSEEETSIDCLVRTVREVRILHTGHGLNALAWFFQYFNVCALMRVPSF